MAKKEDLPLFDGMVAYDGAIRFIRDADLINPSIRAEFGRQIAELRIFAEDAFGTIYGLLKDDTVAIFWPETAELEVLGVSLDEFYTLILQDPDGTISYELYKEGVKCLGKPMLDEHFAFKIEIALGGKLSVDNLEILKSSEHFKALAKIAKQIKDMPIGQVIDNVKLE